MTQIYLICIIVILGLLIAILLFVMVIMFPPQKMSIQDVPMNNDADEYIPAMIGIIIAFLLYYIIF